MALHVGLVQPGGTRKGCEPVTFLQECQNRKPEPQDDESSLGELWCGVTLGTWGLK